MPCLLIWGAGGHGKVVLDIAASQYQEIVLVDDSPSALLILFGRRVYKSLEALKHECGLPENFVIAVGNNHARANCFRRAIEAGMTPILLAHSTAVISQYAEVGPGTVVMPNVVINAGAAIGANAIINTGAVVEHDCRIGDHVRLSPAAVIGGGAVVDDFAHVGIGGILLPKSHVGSQAVVGAGAVVLRAVAEQLTVAGVPARPIPSRMI